VAGSDDIPEEILGRIRSVCLALPGAQEQDAWVGMRWRVRGHTFAHVLTVESGRPASYARAAGMGAPYFRTQWGREVGGAPGPTC
jgi:hypothetical protein